MQCQYCVSDTQGHKSNVHQSQVIKGCHWAVKQAHLKLINKFPGFGEKSGLAKTPAHFFKISLSRYKLASYDTSPPHYLAFLENRKPIINRANSIQVYVLSCFLSFL